MGHLLHYLVLHPFYHETHLSGNKSPHPPSPRYLPAALDAWKMMEAVGNLRFPDSTIIHISQSNHPAPGWDHHNFTMRLLHWRLHKFPAWSPTSFAETPRSVAWRATVMASKSSEIGLRDPTFHLEVTKSKHVLITIYFTVIVLYNV